MSFFYRLIIYIKRLVSSINRFLFPRGRFDSRTLVRLLGFVLGLLVIGLIYYIKYQVGLILLGYFSTFFSSLPGESASGGVDLSTGGTTSYKEELVDTEEESPTQDEGISQSDDIFTSDEDEVESLDYSAILWRDFRYAFAVGFVFGAAGLCLFNYFYAFGGAAVGGGYHYPVNPAPIPVPGPPVEEWHWL